VHYKLDILAERGYVVLGDYDGAPIRSAEWESLEYMDWKSGGDTNFAPLTSATGEMNCRNRQIAPGLARHVEEIGGNYGQVRVLKLNPCDEAAALRQLHRDDNNRLNPDGSGWVVRSWLELDNTPGESVFILREDKADPATETRIRLHPGMQVVIDSERLWHAVWHPGPRPRYALITSWESDRVIDNWIALHAVSDQQLLGAGLLARGGLVVQRDCDAAGAGDHAWRLITDSPQAQQVRISLSLCGRTSCPRSGRLVWLRCAAVPRTRFSPPTVFRRLASRRPRPRRLGPRYRRHQSRGLPLLFSRTDRRACPRHRLARAQVTYTPLGILKVSAEAQHPRTPGCPTLGSRYGPGQ
jgi:hypothetical protein